MSVLSFYDQWPQYNRRMVEVVRALDDDGLAVRPAPDGWPIWATVAHTAGARVYWLCVVLGEPGLETAPYIEPTGEGWEDDPDHPRNSDELVMALRTSWAVVADCLERWTPEMLGDTAVRTWRGQSRLHTRGSVLQRLVTHDAYHCGQLSQTLGTHDLPQIDLWRAD
jgi:uncharacterized damage-inducible protein DinB